MSYDFDPLDLVWRKLQWHSLRYLSGRGVVGWAALHNLLVNGDDPNVLEKGFAEGATRDICLLGQLGQHDIHIVTRLDQARDARLCVNLDADGTGTRCQDAGEETPISPGQYVS